MTPPLTIYVTISISKRVGPRKIPSTLFKDIIRLGRVGVNLIIIQKNVRGFLCRIKELLENPSEELMFGNIKKTLNL